MCIRDRVFTANSDIRVYNVQFEPGTVATPYENIPIQTQLANCQRYYNSIEYNIGVDAAVVDGIYYNSFVFPVQMRSNPTIETSYNSDNSVGIATGQVFSQAYNGQSWRQGVRSTINGPIQAFIGSRFSSEL